MHKRTIVDYISVGVLLAFMSLPVIPARLSSQDTEFGTIEGIVVDVDGQPVAGARVSAVMVGVIHKSPPFAETDEQGRFSIKLTALSSYMLHAEREGEWFFGTNSEFFSSGGEVKPTVNVYAGQVTPDVVVQLPPRGAWLVGKVVDASTGKPIKDAQIVLRREDNPKIFTTAPRRTGTEGRFKLLVPSLPVTIEVSAPGYEKWHYREADSTQVADALHLAPADIKKIDIFLQKTK